MEMSITEIIVYAIVISILSTIVTVVLKVNGSVLFFENGPDSKINELKNHFKMSKKDAEFIYYNTQLYKQYKNQLIKDLFMEYQERKE